MQRRLITKVEGSKPRYSQRMRDVENRRRSSRKRLENKRRLDESLSEFQLTDFACPLNLINGRYSSADLHIVLQQRSNCSIQIETLFDRIVCINLDRRPDRWSSFQEHIASIDWPFTEAERFSATDGAKVNPPAWFKAGGGAWGCLQSHIRILEQSLQDGIQSLLILEDDAVFAESFHSDVLKFFNTVPSDWDGVMLGGQHLKQPEFVSDGVVRIRNGNRTHAHALRGRFIEAVYQHLTDWPSHSQRPKQHVDHRMGVMHESGKFNVYAPNPWLVSQAAGFSNINGQRLPERDWQGSVLPRSSNTDARRTAELNNVTAVAVMGPYRSGTSCVAGILQQLGVHMGERLGQPNKNNPSGFFEAQWLAQQCRRMYDEPALASLAPEPDRIDLLRQWATDQRRIAHWKQTIVGAKHPLFCMMGDDLLKAWGENTKFIAVYRPFDESLASLNRTGWWDVATRKSCLQHLWDARDEFLSRTDHLHVDFHDLKEDPRSVVDRVIEYLKINPTHKRISNAVGTVRRDESAVFVSAG